MKVHSYTNLGLQVRSDRCLQLKKSKEIDEHHKVEKKKDKEGGDRKMKIQVKWKERAEELDGKK